jgi:GTPase SAR1 family protein
LVLIGNKNDLSYRAVSLKEIQDAQLKYNCEYYEVSAKEDTNLNDLFTNSLNKLIEKHTLTTQDSLLITKNPIKKTGCCY